MVIFASMAVAASGCSLVLSWLDCWGHGVLNAKEEAVRKYMDERAQKDETGYMRI